ncbi:lysylphosphatidylglycerol synthase domain-containing protein [Falsiroseomonas sp. HW251]|uniref:lysylphosphatidylglycerol synthase domain-containing protein n=1 Tax=Falsiroseomonas sp. HW251 TaxID=3390998 RepID=UPI003D30F0A2
MRRLARAWPVLVGAAALGWVALTFDWGQAGAALARIRPWPLLPEVFLLSLAVYAACAVRWMAISRLPWRARTMASVHAYVTVTIALGIATPMQLGEALKVKYARDAGLPLGASAVNLVQERLLDLAAIAAMAAAGLLHGLTGSAALALAALLLPVPVALLPRLGRRWIARSPRLLAWTGPPLPAPAVGAVLAATVAKWGLTLATWLALLAAVDVVPGPWQGMLLLGAVAGAGIVSMVPAGLGVQEVSAMALLAAMGYPAEAAEAGALALRLLLPVMLVIGVLHLPLLRHGAPRNG